jgi:hypothetical protein
MRTFILTLAVLAGLLVIPAPHTGSSAAPEMAIGTAVLDAHALEAQEGPQIKVEINKGGGDRMWYANPLWMAIGGLALVMLIVLIVMATKGGGTTVVKG